MSKPDVLVRLTLAQADALLFACAGALAEPANFELGSGDERTEAPLKRARDKIIAALQRSAIKGETP
ncbi:MAG TPA: hypothetical protein VK634_19735 [Reyranella sp.]|nr:hypothetical protein [Reyranella sp.]HTE82927.1 hypothetical protein [Reyranella sp.]